MSCVWVSFVTKIDRLVYYLSFSCKIQNQTILILFILSFILKSLHLATTNNIIFSIYIYMVFLIFSKYLHISKYLSKKSCCSASLFIEVWVSVDLVIGCISFGVHVCFLFPPCLPFAIVSRDFHVVPTAFVTTFGVQN